MTDDRETPAERLARYRREDAEADQRLRRILLHTPAAALAVVLAGMLLALALTFLGTR